MVKLSYHLPLAAAAASLLAAPSVQAFAPLASSRASVGANQQLQKDVSSKPFKQQKQQQHENDRNIFTSLHSSSSSNSEINPYTTPQLDTSALTKYLLAGITELTLFGTTFHLLDLATTQFDATLPFPLTFALFYGCSLKSRVFNPLNNQRPDRSKAQDTQSATPGFRDRIMPSWTPPGVTFPIMWVLIIGPIRAYSASLIVSSTHTLFCAPIMAFMLHLTIGDIWNTMNNTEKRYGAAVIGVLCVVLSAANAAQAYASVDPFAGKLLGGTLIWLCTAAALITDTWRLNPVVDGEGVERLVPLFPVVGEAETEFMWFANGDDDEKKSG